MFEYKSKRDFENFFTKKYNFLIEKLLKILKSILSLVSNRSH